MAGNTSSAGTAANDGNGTSGNTTAAPGTSGNGQGGLTSGDSASASGAGANANAGPTGGETSSTSGGTGQAGTTDGAATTGANGSDTTDTGDASGTTATTTTGTSGTTGTASSGTTGTTGGATTGSTTSGSGSTGTASSGTTGTNGSSGTSTTGGATGSPSTCAGAPSYPTTDACSQCTCANCSTQLAACYDSADPTRNAQCVQVRACSETNRCASDSCYCGADTGLACLLNPAGPCVAEIQSVVGSTSTLDVTAARDNPQTALYQSNQVALCARNSCAQQCGL